MEMWTTNNSTIDTLLGVNRNLSNISSHNQLCTGSYHPAVAFFDIIMVVVNLPITLCVIAELLLRQCWAPSNPGNSSPFSMSEIFFLHLYCLHFFYYIGTLLTIVRNFGGVTGIRQEYIMTFHSTSLIGAAFFFTGMVVDMYMAVVHPIAYVGYKMSTKKIIAHIYCTLIWLYSITLGIVEVIFNISMYDPLPLTSFYGTIPIGMFCCILMLITLRTSGPGKSQTSKMDKTKQRAIRFIVNSMIVLTFYSLPRSCLLIYTTIKKIEWENLPCQALTLLLFLQIAEFLAPLLFFYNSGRLEVMATHCSSLFQNNIC